MEKYAEHRSLALLCSTMHLVLVRRERKWPDGDWNDIVPDNLRSTSSDTIGVEDSEVLAAEMSRAHGLIRRFDVQYPNRSCS
jgi:hypothetical protein